jgi:predicted ATPase
MEDEEAKVDALSTTVHKKTEGNAFFVLMFLRALYDDELLKYNFGVMRWMWDDDMVNEKLVTENVATSKYQTIILTQECIILCFSVCCSMSSLVSNSHGEQT